MIMTYADFGLDARNVPANYTAYYTADYTDSTGKRFRIEHHYDGDAGAPWDNDDCHGPVSDWVTRNKRPGELVLSVNGKCKRFYDFQAAIKAQREVMRDRWYIPKGRTRQDDGYDLVCTVMSDYEYLRDWCNDEWHYMGIVVFPLTADGDELRSKSQSLWGIESDSDAAYIQEETEYLLREAGAEL